MTKGKFLNLNLAKTGRKLNLKFDKKININKKTDDKKEFIFRRKNTSDKY